MARLRLRPADAVLLAMRLLRSNDLGTIASDRVDGGLCCFDYRRGQARAPALKSACCLKSVSFLTREDSLGLSRTSNFFGTGWRPLSEKESIGNTRVGKSERKDGPIKQ